jgi:hypothetical protein
VRLGRARREAGGLLNSKPAICEAEGHDEIGKMGILLEKEDDEDRVFVR